MRIITWNVNSVRARLPRLLALLGRHAPDVVCLQELKVGDDSFPHEAIRDAGYSAAVFGQRTYNGVALLGRRPPERVERGFPGDPVPGQARVIAADFEGVRVVNLYVVNGQEVDTDAFRTKLAWLDAMTAWLAATRDPAAPLVLAGDFNIAPDDRDVYDPGLYRGRVHFSRPEHDRLGALLRWGLKDLLRLVTDEAGIYTWWDYRQGSFHRDHGLRIDLVLGTGSVAERCRAVRVDKEERRKLGGEGAPSDHAPVIVDLDPL